MFTNLLKGLFANKVIFVSTLVLVITTILALAAEFVSLHNPKTLNVYARLQSPSMEFFFGTDHLGRDVFSRVIFGARISLVAGFASVVISTVVGVLVGLLAGYFTVVDRLLMRLMDGLMAFPVILLAIALMAALGPSLINVVFALSLVYAPRTARIVRGAVLVVKETMYIEAASALGVRTPGLIFRHILPNCLSPIIVQATFTFAYAVQAEAALSFLGAGVPPVIPSWGIMLSEARLYMVQAPWTALVPGIAIAMTVLSLNAIGDGLRDMLDPRFKSL